MRGAMRDDRDLLGLAAAQIVAGDHAAVRAEPKAVVRIVGLTGGADAGVRRRAGCSTGGVDRRVGRLLASSGDDRRRRAFRRRLGRRRRRRRASARPARRLRAAPTRGSLRATRTTASRVRIARAHTSTKHARSATCHLDDLPRSAAAAHVAFGNARVFGNGYALRSGGLALALWCFVLRLVRLLVLRALLRVLAASAAWRASVGASLLHGLELRVGRLGRRIGAGLLGRHRVAGERHSTEQSDDHEQASEGPHAS